MSPVVRRLPTTVRSADNTEAATLPLGAEGVKSIEGLFTGASGALGLSASPGLAPGSLMRLLENIFGCLYEGHRIDGGPADADLIVKVSAGRPARVAHITDQITARHFLSHVNPDLRQMGIARFDTEGVLDLDQATIAVFPVGVGHNSVSGGIDRAAIGPGKILPLVLPKAAPHRIIPAAKARCIADSGADRHGKGRLEGRDAIHVHLVQPRQNGVGTNFLGRRLLAFGGQNDRSQRAALTG